MKYLTVQEIETALAKATGGMVYIDIGSRSLQACICGRPVAAHELFVHVVAGYRFSFRTKRNNWRTCELMQTCRMRKFKGYVLLSGDLYFRV